MNILAFGASTSKQSINKQFATYAAQQFSYHNVEVIDLNNYEPPLFSVDVEKEIGHPESVHQFIAKLDNADLIIISMAEHNGGYTAAFKNLFDWASRVKLNMFEGKKMLLLSTSPGGRGGQGSLAMGLDRFPRHGADIVASFSLPKFYENFDAVKGITDGDLTRAFQLEIQKVQAVVG